MDKVAEGLRVLGIEPDRVGLVALLPLVRVAWADGAIQDAERERILAVADTLGLRDGRDRAVVDAWLTEAPSGWFLSQAGLVLRALRSQVLPDGVAPDDIVTHCVELAQIAGGLFGSQVLAFTPSEREALAAIAADLGVERADLVPQGEPGTTPAG